MRQHRFFEKARAEMVGGKIEFRPERNHQIPCLHTLGPGLQKTPDFFDRLFIKAHTDRIAPFEQNRRRVAPFHQERIDSKCYSETRIARKAFFPKWTLGV